MTDARDVDLSTFKKRVSEWSDHKRLVGQTDRAVAVFEQLAAESERSSAIVSPWPELVAYRLAMLLLRRGPSADLARVDALLERAQECEALGPRPLLYLLGVLHRRRLASTPHAAAELDRRLDRTFEAASLKTLARQSAGNWSAHRLQDDVFNQLELAAVFLGRDMQDLEGRDGPFGALGLDERVSWRIVESGPGARSLIRYPSSALAVCEVEARRSFDPSLFLIREEEERGHFSYWLPGGEGWIRDTTSPPWTALEWALAIKAPPAVDQAPASTNRQTLKRAREWFTECLGVPLIEGSLSDGLTLPPSPPILFVTRMSRRGP